MTILIIGAIVLLIIALVASFKGYGWTAVVAFIALWLVGASGAVLTTWGITSFLVWGLTVILPQSVAGSSRGQGYVVIGAIVGTILGLLIGYGGPVIGAVTGTIFGGVAYGLTPDGRALGFPSTQFFNYLAAKGFPAAVTMSIIGETVRRLF